MAPVAAQTQERHDLANYPAVIRPWMLRARCGELSEEELEDFFPISGDNRARIQRAKAVCSSCPVSLECLLYAYRTKDEWAILGGTTPEERECDGRS